MDSREDVMLCAAHDPANSGSAQRVEHSVSPTVMVHVQAVSVPAPKGVAATLSVNVTVSENRGNKGLTNARYRTAEHVSGSC